MRIAYLLPYFFLFTCLLTINAEAAKLTALEKGLLWEISRDGVVAGYLFGTIHSEDERVTTLAEEVQYHFDQADSVILELSLNPFTLMQSMSSMYLPLGQTLDKFLNEKEYKLLVTNLAQQGIPEAAIKIMKPWAIMTALSSPKAKTGEFLDLLLYKQATQRGLTVQGLETATEQIAVFDSFSIEEQVLMLKETVEQIDVMPDMLEKIHTLYLQRDLKAMLDFYEELSKSSKYPELMQLFNQRILDDRNIRMLERMQPYLKKGNAFIGVGALHLAGEKGLLRLLEKQRYRIKAIW